MNAKRQTIWLVSMLSLMVVLSAYYLFTEDVNNLQLSTATDTKAEAGTASPSVKEIVVNTNDLNGKQAPADTNAASKTGAAAAPDAKQPAANTAPEQKSSSTKTDESSKAKPDEATGAKTDTKTEVKTDAKADVKTDAKGDQPASATAVSAADAKVLQQVQTQVKSGQGYFDSLVMQRNESLSKLSEKWLTILADPKQTPEAAANAEAELRKIQDNEAKVSDLEDALTKDFANAIVTQDANKWKVTVQSDNLQKSQAVSIVEKVMQELSVGPESIVVTYVP
ncbi:SpoIIIAH-like family protein [Paenibacillus sp. TAB 01]|uniref:SpoIIIAH-like family protein n=1 Tax=Paenibacillus sp. TAB 01 TaxID=3368988 RepID=UPI003750E7C5